MVKMEIGDEFVQKIFGTSSMEWKERRSYIWSRGKNNLQKIEEEKGK